jgi:AraC-like DNA-binding protein
VLLEDRALSLSQIAVDTGFADQSHMTRRVKEQTGHTPGTWRRRITAYGAK